MLITKYTIPWSLAVERWVLDKRSKVWAWPIYFLLALYGTFSVVFISIVTILIALCALGISVMMIASLSFLNILLAVVGLFLGVVYFYPIVLYVYRTYRRLLYFCEKTEGKGVVPWALANTHIAIFSLPTILSVFPLLFYTVGTTSFMEYLSKDFLKPEGGFYLLSRVDIIGLFGFALVFIIVCLITSIGLPWYILAKDAVAEQMQRDKMHPGDTESDSKNSSESV